MTEPRATEGDRKMSLWTFFRRAATQTWEDSAPGRLWRRIVDRLGYAPIVLVVAMVIWFIVFARLVYRRHELFASFAFDLGIFDQSIWLLSRGEQFITVRGLETFGHHANVGFFLLAPFYWVGAGAHFLNLLQLFALTAGAIPVYLIGRDLLDNDWLPLVPALAFMTHFSAQWLNQELFHPEALAVTPLLFAYRAATKRKWTSYSLWLALAVSWKEDVALAAFGLGLLLFIRTDRKAGLWTMAAATAWFAAVTYLIIPAFSSEGTTFYAGFFGELGSSAPDVIWTSITNPGLVVERLETANALGYVRDLSLPYAFTSFLSPLALLIGLPQIMVNLLSVHGPTSDVHFHYVAIPLAAFTIAMLEGLARLKRVAMRRAVVGAVGAFALSTVVAFGLTPFSRQYQSGAWALESGHRIPAMSEAITIPPGDASVVATYNFVPHLTHRRDIFMWPNPFEVSYWGVVGENQRSPDQIDWIVADMHILGETRDFFDQLVVDPAWEVVFDRDQVVVLRRAP